MAQLKDLTSVEAVNQQLAMYGNTAELLADSMQDLKEHLRIHNHGNCYQKHLSDLSDAQNKLYAVAIELGYYEDELKLK